MNTSRTWTIHVLGFVAPHHPNGPALRRELVYRHIAWLAALRTQLRRRQQWEHQAPFNDRARADYGVLDMSDDQLAALVEPFIGPEETAWLRTQGNKASQLLRRQSERLRDLHGDGHFDDFRHMELANVLETLFTHQGKAERIKLFPLPRQYSTGAHVFVTLFVQLVPLALVPLFAALGPGLTWLAIPASMMVGWVFGTWDVIVDYTENPFEGLVSDIPMTAMSRSIEIDLRQMLGESHLPPAIRAQDHVLL